MSTNYQHTFKNNNMRITTNITGSKNQQQINHQTSVSQQKQNNIQQAFQNNKNQQNLTQYQVIRQGTSQQPQRQIIQPKQYYDPHNQQNYNISQNTQKVQFQQISNQNKGSNQQVQQNKYLEEQTYKTNKQPFEYKNPINPINPVQKTAVAPKKFEQKQTEQRPPSSKNINSLNLNSILSKDNKKEQPSVQKAQITIQNPVENQKIKDSKWNQVPKEKRENNQLENQNIESTNTVAQNVNERNNQQFKVTLNQSNNELQQTQQKEKNALVLQEKTNSNQVILKLPSQQKTEINQIQDVQKYPVALLLGTYGVGKKWLMHKLFPNHKHQAFVPVFHPEIQIQIAFAHTFDFDTDIQKREEQIQQYQQFFKKYQGQICQFFILVDHEQGISKMKQQINLIYKYFKSFKEMITIIVNKFTKKTEQIESKSALSFYTTNNIILIQQNESDVSSIIKQESKIKEKKYELILKDTIFESQNNNNQSDKGNQVQSQNLEIKELSKNSQQQQPPLSQKQIETSKKVQQQNSQPQKSIALILGTLGVGKKSLMRKMFPSNSIQILTPLYYQPLSYNIALAPDFDFDSNIESRENQISSYQKFFHLHRTDVKKLFVVVNFERTDLMKNKVISIFKYFRKFKELITIIVTQFQLSENAQQDQENLKKAFKLFTSNDSIIFLREDQKKDDLCRLIEPHLKQKIADNFEFDCRDTIFEMDDPQESQAMQDKLNQMVKKIEEGNRRRN